MIGNTKQTHEMEAPACLLPSDETASIGRRYTHQDEVAPPFSVTIDFDSLGEKGPELLGTVKLRHRDSGEQERLKISELLGKLVPMVS